MVCYTIHIDNHEKHFNSGKQMLRVTGHVQVTYTPQECILSVKKQHKLNFQYSATRIIFSVFCTRVNDQ